MFVFSKKVLPRQILRIPVLIMVFVMAFTIFPGITPARAESATTTVYTGNSPTALAVNPVTNKIYAVNKDDGTVTVIDGDDNTIQTVPVGSMPDAAAVNAATNKTYVGNVMGQSVTVIDGETNATETIDVGMYANEFAINPVTNKIYVVSYGYDRVIVLDGADNSITATIDVGDAPTPIAVNPATNKIYVGNLNDDSITVIDGATNQTETVNVGDRPIALAVNPVTNKIYVANQGASGVGCSVMVIDGASNTVTGTVDVGYSPGAVAVNPVTNQIYVVNQGTVSISGSGSVTVIDGATDTVADTVDVGNSPNALAVNPLVNKIYVTNRSSNSVTVIDGADNTAATIGVGGNPYTVAVNPATNKIYVANEVSNNVTVIYGTDNTTETVGAGDRPLAVAVNPATNKIYVVNMDTDDVTVINGADNTTETVDAGLEPAAVAINPVTNKIYVTNRDHVTVIDGADNTVTTVNTGDSPCAVAVNIANNKIYVTNNGSDNVTVIDGATNTTETIDAGTAPCAVAASPTTCKVYVANRDSGNVTVISDHTVLSGIMETSIAPLAGHITRNATPSFQLSAERMAGSAAPAIQQIWCRVDSFSGEWEKARPSGSSGNYTSEALTLGEHVLYAFATDGRDAGQRGNPVIGSISSYAFTVLPSPPVNSSGGRRTNNSSALAELTAGDYGTSLTITIDTRERVASARMDASTLDKAFNENGTDSGEAKTVKFTMPEAAGVDNYMLELPASVLAMKNPDRTIELKTEAGTVTLPGNMLEGTGLEDAGLIGISIGKGNKSSLPGEVKEAIGDRPLVQLTLTIDGKETEWNNPDAPVTVSIPYIPTAEELADPEHITIWYIDGSGTAVSVPSGKYDVVTGTVTFRTTHFSKFAAVYVTKTFDDLKGAAWAKNSIEVLASKGILKGQSEKGYAPQTNITRADFLYFLIKTLDVHVKSEGNFDDISKDAYYYKEIAIAKELGITGGTGKNKFNPHAGITRQDMMVLTERALRMVGTLEAQGTDSDLDVFADKSLVASYAVDGVASVIKEGLIIGSGGYIDPLRKTTRAEAAVFLYRLYNK